ncbi:MAG: hypothetical protein WCJ96_11255 [Verrucomicrobiota bacterium]
MTEDQGCPDFEAEFDRIQASLGAVFVDAFDKWIKDEGGDARADAVVATVADVCSGCVAQVSPEGERDMAASAAILTILERSGCNVGAVLEFVREQMEEHLGPVGHA